MTSPRQTRASKLSAQSQIVTRHTKPSLKKVDKLSPIDTPVVKEINDDGTIVWNEDTEPILFRNVLRLKPVGPMKHWRMMLVRKRVSQELDYPVSTQAIWNHLSTLFDMKSLDELETADKIQKDESFSLPRSILRVKMKDSDVLPDGRSRKNSNSFSNKGDTDAEGEDFTAPPTLSAGKKGPHSPKPGKRRTNTPTLNKKLKSYDSPSGGGTSDPEMDDMSSCFRDSASELDYRFDDDSNQDSTSELEELSRKSSFSKSFSPSKRKSSESSTSKKGHKDRPSTPSESSKRSRTPVGVTKRGPRHSESTDDGKL